MIFLTHQKKNILDKACKNNESIVWYFTNNSLGYDLCTNPLTMLRKNDFVCLRNTPEIMHIWEYEKNIYQLSDQQVFFYEDFKDTESERSVIKSFLNFFSNNNVVVFPNKTNPILNEEIKNFNIKIFNDNSLELPDKRWFHDTIPTSSYTNNFFNVSLPREVKIPRGYTCYDKSEIMEAIKILEIHKIQNYLIKEVSSSGGENIYFPESREELEDFMQNHISFDNQIENNYLPKAYVVEEMIVLKDKKPCDTFVVHYLGDQICPGIFKQHSTKFGYAGISCEQPPPSTVDNIKRQSEIISKTLKLKGPWGMDFVIDGNGNPFLIDLNSGRICGSHYIRIFKDLYASDILYFDAWNFALHYYYDLYKIHNELILNNLEFNFNNQTGVILSRVGETWNGTVMFFSNDKEEIKIFTDKFINILKNNANPTEYNEIEKYTPIGPDQSC